MDTLTGLTNVYIILNSLVLFCDSKILKIRVGRKMLEVLLIHYKLEN